MAAQRILIVDDDLDSLKLSGRMLQRQGYVVSEASNSAMALDRARADTPDLIILGVMMPDMEGFDMACELLARVGFETTETPDGQQNPMLS